MYLKKLQSASRFNPFWKGVARHLVKECERCGQPKLYSIFDAYISDGKPPCIGCSTAFRFARPLIKCVFKKTNLREGDVKKLGSILSLVCLRP